MSREKITLVHELVDYAVMCTEYKTKINSIRKLCWSAQEDELNMKIKYHDSTDYKKAEVMVSDILKILDMADSSKLEKIISEYKNKMMDDED